MDVSLPSIALDNSLHKVTSQNLDFKVNNIFGEEDTKLINPIRTIIGIYLKYYKSHFAVRNTPAVQIHSKERQLMCLLTYSLATQKALIASLKKKRTPFGFTTKKERKKGLD